MKEEEGREGSAFMTFRQALKRSVRKFYQDNRCMKCWQHLLDFGVVEFSLSPDIETLSWQLCNLKVRELAAGLIVSGVMDGHYAYNMWCCLNTCVMMCMRMCMSKYREDGTWHRARGLSHMVMLYINNVYIYILHTHNVYTCILYTYVIHIHTWYI